MRSCLTGEVVVLGRILEVECSHLGRIVGCRMDSDIAVERRFVAGEKKKADNLVIVVDMVEVGQDHSVQSGS